MGTVVMVLHICLLRVPLRLVLFGLLRWLGGRERGGIEQLGLSRSALPGGYSGGFGGVRFLQTFVLGKVFVGSLVRY